jgi:hypothetical protein
MGCCDKDKNNTNGCCDKDNSNTNTNTNPREYPEDIDACCNVRGRRCFCLPYDDAFMITAQVVSIVALCVSWIWWATFLISLAGMAMVQVLWCCRQNKATVLGSAGVATLSALAQVGVGIYVLIRWAKSGWCDPFIFYTDDYDYSAMDDDWDWCPQKTWGALAFVCAALWAGTAVCVLWFVFGGRHARWEEKHSRVGGEPQAAINEENTTTNNNNDVEEPGAIPVATAEAEPAEVVAVTDDDDKIDEV